MRGSFLAAVLVGLFAAACGSSPNLNKESASASSSESSTTATTTTTTTIGTRPSAAPATTTTVLAEPVVDSSSTTTTTAPPTFPVVTPDGRFTYTASYLHTGDNNLRGTLLVDDGSGAVPALRDSRDVFDDIHGIVFGPDGLVTWTSSDYNKGSSLVFIGRIDEMGRIVDSHRVGPLADVWSTVGFDDLGVLTSMTYDGEPYLLDNVVDPFFVMSADPMPHIETDEPLAEEFESEGFWARENHGFWYRGDTLGAEPACGASTLYKDDADGFVRVLDASIELDTVVDVDVAERFDTGGVDSAGGARAVVLSTECAGQYDGRQLFWGVEWIDYGDNGPRFESPLYVAAAFDTTVAEVLHVRAITLNEEWGCCLELGGLAITVELLDGTRTVLEISTAS